MGRPSASSSKRELLVCGLQALCDADADIHAALSDRLDELTVLVGRYLDEIELFNTAYGLISCSGREELIIRHILDSLAPLGIILREYSARYSAPVAPPCRIADLGSGAGLPGIPLSLALPYAQITLVEKTRRRVGFLQNVQAVLSLKNLRVLETSFETLPAASFQALTFRALTPLNKETMSIFLRLLEPNGFVAAYKGTRQKARLEQSGLSNTASSRLIAYHVPFLDEERHLIVASQD